MCLFPLPQEKKKSLGQKKRRHCEEKNIGKVIEGEASHHMAPLQRLLF